MAAVNAAPLSLPVGVHRIEIAVPYLGTVNVWLLEGDPLTLVDTGPANAESLDALEQALTARGRSLDAIELVLLTHHHLDHSGLAGAIAAASGARVAATAGTAAWGSGYHERAAVEAAFGRRLLAVHGVPAGVIEASEPFWDHIVRNSADFTTTDILADGSTVRAGGRVLRVVERPGHSVTDTLFVDETDDVAIVGDHLLREITSGAEVVPLDQSHDLRRRALGDYLDGLRLTAAMQFDVLLPGHGPVISDHRSLVAERLAFHERRLALVAASVDAGGSTAFEIARRVWDDRTAETQAVLAVWEVIGHLDVLAERGLVVEAVDDRDSHLFRPSVPGAHSVAEQS
jgi:glyoxylase-like metal-dependent hydrolase (beta-lactamase superfamily II)